MVKVNRVRRIIRKIDPWTVLKVTFVLNFIIALTIVLGFSILWVLLVNAGVPHSVVFLATVYLLTQTALATIGAFFYNLVSDLVGGVEVVVLEETYSDPQIQNTESKTEKTSSKNKETMLMTFSNTIKNLQNEEDENE